MDQEEGVEIPHLPPRRPSGAGRGGASLRLAARILPRRSGAKADDDGDGGADASGDVPQDGHAGPPSSAGSSSGRSSSSSSASSRDGGGHHHRDALPPGGYYTSPPPRLPHLPPLTSLRLALREARHAPCLMAPPALLVLLAVAVSSLAGLVLALPQLALGLLLGPLVRRSFWLVEFVYRHPLGRWGHVKIMEVARSGGRGGDGKKKGANTKPGGHSATLEQRIEVVPGRVYVHPVPMFVDNVAYLVVCLPPPHARHLPIAAVLVDCGDHAAALGHAGAVYRRHYEGDHPRNANRRKVGMELCAVLCTHRHHDHTAGVGGMVLELTRTRLEEGADVAITAGSAGGGGGDDGSRSADSEDEEEEEEDVYADKVGNVLVVGAAVEGVPRCNLFARDGCFVPLPCVSSGGECNDMNDVVSVEAVACPGHTRGSVVYALRNRPAPGVPVGDGGAAGGTPEPPLASHLFTGDVVFTGGSGVAFEADLERAGDDFAKRPGALGRKDGSSRFRPGAGSLSTERCFAEVLVRADGPWGPCGESPSAVTPSDPSAARYDGAATEAGDALIYPGHEYTTDCLLRQFHPRNVPPGGEWTRLPPSTFFEVASSYFVGAHRRSLPAGQRLLTVPTPMSRELRVNPNYRSLRRRADHAVRALRLWYEYGCRTRLPDDDDGGDATAAPNGGGRRDGGGPPSVFTTVFTADLDEVVSDLRSSRVDRESAADRIDALRRRMDEDLVGRRAIPGKLPSHKAVYLGVVAVCVLGSPPSAVTASDASIMGMARPEENTDRILISRRRLLAALIGLGAVPGDMTPGRVAGMLRLLWRESRIDDVGRGEDVDPESTPEDDDGIELGLLKLTLFGVGNGMSSTKLCMPCGSKPAYDLESWVTTSRLKRTDGMLVRHDPMKDPACRGVFLSGM